MTFRQGKSSSWLSTRHEMMRRGGFLLFTVCKMIAGESAGGASQSSFMIAICQRWGDYFTRAAKEFLP